MLSNHQDFLVLNDEGLRNHATPPLKLPLIQCQSDLPIHLDAPHLEPVFFVKVYNSPPIPIGIPDKRMFDTL